MAMRAAPSILLAALALSACAGQPGVPGAMVGWNRKLEPYRVIDNVYYVGSNGIAQFLIATSAGLILLDTGFEASVPRLRENVAALGFRFEDVKVIVTSHAHIDHVQAHALVRRLTGAQVVSSALDAADLQTGGKNEAVFGGVYEWTPCPVDRVVADGEKVTLGDVTLTARLTPGHTRGAITWTMQVAESPPGGHKLDVVFFPSANVLPGVKLIGNARYPRIAEDFERSYAVWKALPCDVFLGVHGVFYGMDGKRRRQQSDASLNPFVDPAGYRAFVAENEAAFREQLASEGGR